ncbi:hypothetical protein D1631_18095 [Chryseobacterium nematophagum]|uniref:Uncharacterized protein n=1 Tax=Chryseobacterium nematophagum TaxID=2305228 RepID=A0A3M7TLU3_9FLAO|nr:hypothetical protein D1631_18095 [Chryseobacterium nematophagum]
MLESFENGGTRKQLLARSKYLLYKSRDKWSKTQRQRAGILFSQSTDLEKSYHLI